MSDCTQIGDTISLQYGRRPYMPSPKGEPYFESPPTANPIGTTSNIPLPSIVSKTPYMVAVNVGRQNTGSIPTIAVTALPSGTVVSANTSQVSGGVPNLYQVCAFGFCQAGDTEIQVSVTNPADNGSYITRIGLFSGNLANIGSTSSGLGSVGATSFNMNVNTTTKAPTLILASNYHKYSGVISTPQGPISSSIKTWLSSTYNGYPMKVFTFNGTQTAITAVPFTQGGAGPGLDWADLEALSGTQAWY